MANKINHQHPQLRVPSSWEGEAKAFIIQLQNVLNDIYAKLAKIQEELDALAEEEEE